MPGGFHAIIDGWFEIITSGSFHHNKYPTGLRSINLYHGDICTSSDELLVISSNAGKYDFPSGAIINSLYLKFDVEFTDLNPILTIDQAGSIGTFRGEINPSSTHPSKEIFLVKMPSSISVAEHGDDPVEFYGRAIWTLFGSLAAYEQKNCFFDSMSLPILAGSRGYPEKEIMEILLSRSANWVKTS